MRTVGQIAVVIQALTFPIVAAALFSEGSWRPAVVQLMLVPITMLLYF